MQTINKAEALKRLSSLENEAKELRKIIDTPTKVTDRIKTFEDACAEVGEDPNNIKFTVGDPDDIAYQKLKVIIKALNEGWKPNWNDYNERKWRLWFYMDSPGFRLYDAGYVHSYASVGSRLCFKSEELALYAAEQFKPLYKDLFTY